MFPLLFLAYVIAVKVFKKTTPNGKITVYLGKRDFIDHLDHVDPIDGIVVVDNDYLSGRRLYGQVTTTYRYGREEDEVMGVKFSKELVLTRQQLVPPAAKTDLTPIQLQYAPSSRGIRLPSSLVSKGFTFSQGKLNLEVTLDKETYYHGERIAANVIVSNNSRKAVRNMKVQVVQHCEVTMVNAQYSRQVASLETKEGCPIIPGSSFKKVFYLVPLASSNRDKHGIALDGYLKDDDVNLASSTLMPEGQSPTDAVGIFISYSLRVKLNCGTLGGELVTDVPFKLLHPAPGTVEHEKEQAIKKSRSIERSHYESSRYVPDEEDNIVFEDFARLRLSEAE
ncbi:Phosrestin-1 [Cryptotermes secundus]|uniref:Phosrestin-1 n=1 Tax=Cryptotermes secundus TaxID=105785 RepID=A0A2J7PZC8_9NEOP|nr:arrestin homolog [Cryptotermes secundus]PNF21670.1 Phosrestin-1 [Cryptotermes secundus]